MATNETRKLDRTWLCSVTFADIVNYSSQSVELQVKWKDIFNEALSEALQSVPPDDRVLIDTGDGASICFLGDPEAALTSTLSLRATFALRASEDPLSPQVRLGINLGPVKLVTDINGNRNAIGDGINVAQRIMSFAEPNQILVSRSYFEVISRLSDDYVRLFRNLGVRQDKHVREHAVYELTPPGVQNAGAPEVPNVAPTHLEAAPAPPIARSGSPSSNRMAVVVAILIALLAAAAAALFSLRRPPPAQDASAQQPSTKATGETSSDGKLAEARQAQALIDEGKYSAAVDLLNQAIPAHPNASRLYCSRGDAYRKQDEFERAVVDYTECIRLAPANATAHLRRAESLAALRKDDQALADYNTTLQLRPNSAPAFNGRGLFFLRLGKYQDAIRDFSEALRVSPDYSPAYLNRSRARRAIGDVQGATEDAKKADELGANRDDKSALTPIPQGNWMKLRFDSA